MPTLIASTNITGLQLKEGTAPATPASGYLRIYAASDSTCHILNDGASDIDVSGLATGKIALASQAANDLQYASSATQWARIANGTTGQILTATTAGAPGWAAPAVPTTITVADTTSATCYVGLFESATGNLAPKSDAGLSYNASTGVLYATGFNGPITGAVTGNASTATKLATARAINGVDFDGSAAITVTAAAGTLSGNTLASGVTASSLTSVGTITSGVWNAGAITSSGTISVVNASDARIILNRTNGSGVSWDMQSYNDGKLYIGQTGVVSALTFAPTTGAATFASSISATGGTFTTAGPGVSIFNTASGGYASTLSIAGNSAGATTRGFSLAFIDGTAYHQWASYGSYLTLGTAVTEFAVMKTTGIGTTADADGTKLLTIAAATGNTTIGGTLTIGTNLISYGANDSAGTGYRLVRVPNA